MDLSLASRARGEAIQKQQAGTQNVMGAAQNFATFMGGQQAQQDLFSQQTSLNNANNQTAIDIAKLQYG